MKKHKDLLAVLRSNNLRITPPRRALLQFIINHHKRQISMKEFHEFIEKSFKGVDRSSVYRNLETFKKLEIIQELNLPGKGKCFQYIFDKKVHHYFICKRCGKSRKGKKELFHRIELALQEVHGFSKANLSAVFYGYCKNCSA